MKDFFKDNVLEIRSWPYIAENVIIEKLPAEVNNDSPQPLMPWYTEVNDEYMEFRRPAFWLGQNSILGFILSIASIGFIIMYVSLIVGDYEFIVRDFSAFLFLTLIAVFFAFAVLPASAQIAFLIPKSLPVRFNRKTQKIYTSDISYRGGIFSRRLKVSFKEMDWKDVHGWLVHRHFSRNTPYNGLHLVEGASEDTSSLQQVCLFRTNAPWSQEEWNKQINYILSIWSYCQHYMNYMPVPDESIKPKKFVFLSNNWLFKWPKDFDELSRSSGDITESTDIK